MSATDELGLILEVSRFHALVRELQEHIATLTAERDALRRDLDTNMATTAEMLARLQGVVDSLRAERDALALTLARNCDDWATDDTAIRDALRPILGAIVDGDANGVQPLVDLVELAVHACESAQ